MREQIKLEASKPALGAAREPASLNTNPLLTVQEVALYLRLRPETVRAMVRRGELPGIKIGRVWRFQRDTIEDWVRVAAHRAAQ